MSSDGTVWSRHKEAAARRAAQRRPIQKPVSARQGQEGQCPCQVNAVIAGAVARGTTASGTGRGFESRMVRKPAKGSQLQPISLSKQSYDLSRLPACPSA